MDERPDELGANFQAGVTYFCCGWLSLVFYSALLGGAGRAGRNIPDNAMSYWTFVTSLCRNFPLFGQYFNTELLLK